jgi:hypothetical protein
MNRHINAIVGRLSSRKPQRDLLEILDRITETVPPWSANLRLGQINSDGQATTAWGHAAYSFRRKAIIPQGRHPHPANF